MLPDKIESVRLTYKSGHSWTPIIAFQWQLPDAIRCIRYLETIYRRDDLFLRTAYRIC